MTNEEAMKKYKELMAFVNDNKEVIERIRNDSLELARFCNEYDKAKKTDWECIDCPFNSSTGDDWACSMVLPFDYELGDASSWVQGVFEKEHMKRKH